MRITRLWIKEFKNLRDVSVDLDARHMINVLIGWNGTGKSNVIEALEEFLGDLDLGEPPAFKDKLEYSCRQRQIIVDADPDRNPAQQIQITYREKTTKETNVESTDDQWDLPQSIRYSTFKRGGGREYLPRNVFGYYSGPSNRLEKHFEIHQRQFYNHLLYPDRYGVDRHSLPLRPLFYARQIHSQFVLLAFFLDEDPAIKRFLEEQLGVLELDSVLFVMRSPREWDWKTRKGGDSRFWHASGIVQSFLGRLYEIALAPHRVKRNRTDEFLYLFVKDRDALKELARELSNADFFKELESTYISDLIEEVRIRVALRKLGTALTFRELSEGEQQLLTVLGLLRFTAEEESLFLLDEPDTHLNPAWGMKYIDFLRHIAGMKDSGDSETNSQIILATHDPIVLSTLKKDQVEIMKRDEGTMQVKAEKPAYDPIGMGYTGILTSDMFGFRSDLDQLTLSRLDRKVQLAEKELLNPEELAELEIINKELEKTGLLEAYSDPYFSQFVKAWARKDRAKRFLKPFLSDADREQMAALADEVINELKEENEH